MEWVQRTLESYGLAGVVILVLAWVIWKVFLPWLRASQDKTTQIQDRIIELLSESNNMNQAALKEQGLAFARVMEKHADTMRDVANKLESLTLTIIQVRNKQ